MQEQTKFKDVIGRYITAGLFIETTNDITMAHYTLEDEDRIVEGVLFKSLKADFIGFMDPNGFYFAKKFFANYKHYKQLLNNKIVCKRIEEWIEEIELQMQADALSAMITHSQGTTGATAAKWLATMGWKTKAGRPSKAQIKAATKKAAQAHEDVDEDYARTMGSQTTPN